MSDFTVYDIGEPELSFISDSATQVLSVMPLSLSHVSERMLTKVAYIDDGQVLQGYFVYDTQNKVFLSNLSDYLGGNEAVNITAVGSAWFSAGETFAVAYVDQNESSYLQTDTGNRIALIENGVVTSGDLVEQATEQVANIGITDLYLNADGQQLVFSTAANNLLSILDTNDAADVMLLDITNSTLRRVSQLTEDDDGDAGSFALGITHKNGTTRVLFETTSTTFSTVDTNDSNDLYVASIISDASLSLVSSAQDNSAASVKFGSSLIQNDEVFFVSDADDLVDNDDNQSSDIFATSIISGDTRRITDFLDNELDSVGVVDYQLLGLNELASKLLFTSNLASVSSSDTSIQQVYSLNVASDTLTVLSKEANGTLGNDTSVVAVMDASGRDFSYQTEASNLIDTPGFSLMLDAAFDYDAQIITSSTQGITGLNVELWGGIGAAAAYTATNGEISIDSLVTFDMIKLSESAAYSDKAINIFDVLATVDHIVGTNLLTGQAFQAADATNDDAVNLFDVLALVDHIVSDDKKIDTYDLVDSSGSRITQLDTSTGTAPQYQLVMNGDVDINTDNFFADTYVGTLDIA